MEWQRSAYRLRSLALENGEGQHFRFYAEVERQKALIAAKPELLGALNALQRLSLLESQKIDYLEIEQHLDELERQLRKA